MADRTKEALRQMAREDPDLAARLVLQTLPAAAARIPGSLAYELEVEDVGCYRVWVEDGSASVGPADGSPGDVDFRLHTDARTLAEMAAGASPVRLMLSGRLRIRGSRRKALKLRAMADGAPPGLDEVVRHGGDVDPDSLYRALPYLIDPGWTRGHRFVVAYEISGQGGGTWYVRVRDGERVEVTTQAPEKVDATGRMSIETLRAVIAGELTPNVAMQRQLTWIDGEVYPVVLLGRWMDRSQGRDDAELRREERQRELLAGRSGTWGAQAGANGAGGSGQGDPGHESEGRRVATGGLLDYGQLYALWERQNWRAHELDFSVDREHWLASPLESQESTAWSLGSFYIGEERVTADLAPFLLAAPSGEVEVFLATQLVDEARHAAFFDRFGAEVMALDSEDLRGRMRELETKMLPAWHDVFDDGLREIANRIKARPDDLDLFVEGIATYHMVVEGVLATTGQHFILKYMEEHGLYPGFQKGFSLVERDEHRHIAFGVRFLKEAVESDPRYGRIVSERIETLVPKAAFIFAPPYAEDPREFVSYGYHSTELYGHAYRALKRRMAVIGLDVPPADELMPGPIDRPEVSVAA